MQRIWNSERRTVRTARACIHTITAVGLVALCACRQGTAPGTAAVAPTTPITTGVLKLIPEGAVIAIALPSIEKSEVQLRALLRRGAPKDVDMDAELKVVTSQIARSADAFEATSLADIAAIKGLDPEKPFAVFFGAKKQSDAPPPPDPDQRRRDAFSYLGLNIDAPMAVVFPYAKRQAARNLSRIGRARDR